MAFAQIPRSSLLLGMHHVPDFFMAEIRFETWQLLQAEKFLAHCSAEGGAIVLQHGCLGVSGTLAADENLLCRTLTNEAEMNIEHPYLQITI